MPKYPEYQSLFQSDKTICFSSVALCDVPVAWVVDEFSFPEPDERASSMPDNMLPAGTNEVLRAKTNEGGYKLTTHCHKLLTIEITITVGIAWSRSSLGLAGLSYSAYTVDYTNFRSSSSPSKLHENEVLPPYICVSRHNPRSSIMLLRPFLTWSHKSLWTRTLRVKD